MLTIVHKITFEECLLSQTPIHIRHADPVPLVLEIQLVFQYKVGMALHLCERTTTPTQIEKSLTQASSRQASTNMLASQYPRHPK